MPRTKEKGSEGEEIAAKFLERKGYEILERNFRYRKGEIDLIGLWNNELLVFFEVKLRGRDDYGDPETFVTRKQENLIIDTAEEYIFAINWQKDIRFDIISIYNGEIEHIEDAFY